MRIGVEFVLLEEGIANGQPLDRVVTDTKGQ